jgi:hypothetical protein
MCLAPARAAPGLAEEVLAVVAPSLAAKVWIWPSTVSRRRAQRAGRVAREQPSQSEPHSSLMTFQPAPANSLELVDDAAVAAHRAVEALQVAVDDPHQVVELLARGERQRAHRFGLVHLAVAEHAPHLRRAAAVERAAVLQVAHEARLVDRADRADAHRAGRELPEVRHQPRVRVADRPRAPCAGARDLLAVVREVALAQPAFEEGARVDARRRVRLEEHQVAAVIAAPLRAEEVVEADLEQIGREA